MTLSTADLCDLYPEAVLLRPIFQDFGGKGRFAGRVRTLRVFEDNALVRKALEAEGQGQVLVVDGGGSLRTALLGGNLARLALERGWSGVVVHGAVRDREELRSLPLGVKALGAVPRRSAKAGRGLVDVPVAFAGARILPSWFLVADGEGILLLPEPPSGGQSGG
ncbi:ribonuclease E activity regulator RraA [Thermus sediminis]|uniref:ribonuclease E activity regulator RraA n=1 Tax=Thermus sediminis TaxID=1761908 RepID=UPI000E3B5A54|nr:ribonuclease E activity regulator RraA [Thermus sediminis]